MPNAYEYLDPDYTYTDPETGVLRNLGNIADRNALEFAESAAHSKRLMELEIEPIKIKDSSALFAIHKHLFQDVYKWAGEKRTVEISKAGRQFFPLDHFDTALVYIDNLISDYQKLGKEDAAKIAHQLADILDTVNELHPFREGNGRTQRELIRSLALEKGYTLNLNPANNSEVYERYMSGTMESNVGSLAALIFELLET